MKKLSDFKDEKSIEVVAELIPPIFDILGNEKNKNLQGESDAFKMFSAFLKNSPKQMMQIFAILSEQEVKDYHCDGIDVAKNLMALVSDKKFMQLFTSQEQMGDATSSADALENTKA